MKHSKLSSALPMLFSSALIFGCPGTESETGSGTDTDSDTEDSDSDDEDSDSVSVTLTTSDSDSMTMTTMDETTDTMTTVDPTDTDPDTTDTDPATTDTTDTDPSVTDTDPSSSTDPTDASSSDGTGETGVVPMDNYNPCEMTADCADGEDCFFIGDNTVCGLLDCVVDAGDCPAPASGDAVPTCVVVDKMGSTACALDCSAGQTCPNGMECTGDFACAWPPMAPGGGQCPDDTLDGVVPFSVDGDNTDLFDDVIPSCTDAGGGVEALYEFTAGDAGIYLFDTEGTAFDTVLFAQTACGGDEITCDDDIEMGNTASLIGVQLDAGQTIIVGVDSYDGDAGAFTLNVSYDAGSDAGSCCDVSMAGGCDAAEIETCVCNIDAFCCDTAWDEVCVGMVPACLGLC